MTIDVRDVPRLAAEAIARRLFGREHFIVFRDHPIVYGRVPKAANSTIKFMLARLLAEPRRGVSADQFWKEETGGQTRMVRTREAAKLGPDRLVFTFVRNPIDRLVSFYDNKVQGDSFLPVTAQKMGIRKNDPFERVVDIVVDTPTSAMDVHVMPQADILLHNGNIVPSFVGRYESFAEDWERLRQEVLGRGSRDIGPFRPRASRRVRARKLEDYYANERLLDAVRKRYEQDFRLFYPHLL